MADKQTITNAQKYINHIDDEIDQNYSCIVKLQKELQEACDNNNTTLFNELDEKLKKLIDIDINYTDIRKDAVDHLFKLNALK